MNQASMAAPARWLLPLVGALLLTTAACNDGAGDDTSDTSDTSGTSDTSDTAGETGASEPITIEEARALADGMSVTVEGYTTVAPGTFNSATGELGFGIQDATGGIYIKTDDVLMFSLDTLVSVTGTLGQMNQLRVIEASADDIEPANAAMTVSPVVAATGNINEDVEGQLVKVTGALTQAVQSDAPYGIKVFINDGSGEVQVFVHLIDDVGVIDTAGLAIGDNIEVVGFVAQYEATYEIAPRQPADLVVLP